MTQEREFYAATVDEAVSKAATELGLPAQEISYSILDEGNSGFLGIGARDARILVETTVASPEARAGMDDPLAATVPGEEVGTEPPVEEPSGSVAGTESSTLAEVYGESSDADLAEAPQELLEEVRVLVSSILEAMNFVAQVEVYDAGGFIAV